MSSYNQQQAPVGAPPPQAEYSQAYPPPQQSYPPAGDPQKGYPPQGGPPPETDSGDNDFMKGLCLGLCYCCCCCYL